MLLDYKYCGTVYSPMRIPNNITTRMEHLFELECEPTKLQDVLYLKVHTHFMLEDLDTGDVFYVLKSIGSVRSKNRNISSLANSTM